METVNGVRISVRDNGGKSFDRYTIVFPGIDSRRSRGNLLHFALGASEFPFHPQGFGQCVEACCGNHLGKTIKFSELPEDVKRFANQIIEGINNQLVLGV